MERYRVFIKTSALKEIEAIDPKADRRRIVRRIRGLAADPRPPGGEKLSGRDRYRLRQGKYRIVYSIEDENLVVYVVNRG